VDRQDLREANALLTILSSPAINQSNEAVTDQVHCYEQTSKVLLQTPALKPVTMMKDDEKRNNSQQPEAVKYR